MTALTELNCTWHRADAPIPQLKDPSNYTRNLSSRCYNKNYNHRIIQTRRDMRRSLVQPPAQSRVSYQFA